MFFYFYFFVPARKVLHYFHFLQKVFVSCVTHSYRSLRLKEALLSGNFVPVICLSVSCRTEVTRHRLLVYEVVFPSLLLFFFYWSRFLRENYVFTSHFCNVCRMFVRKMFFLTHLWFLFLRSFLFVRVNCWIQFRFLITCNKILSHLQQRKCFRTEMSAAFRCIRGKVNSCEKHFKTHQSCVCLFKEMRGKSSITFHPFEKPSWSAFAEGSLATDVLQMLNFLISQGFIRG